MAFEELKQLLASYLDVEAIAQIESAYELAKKAHTGQTRFTGEPYITHPVAVAAILARMHMDPESLMAALLHDVIEDTPVTKEELTALFGPNVAELVDGVSKLAQFSFESRAVEQAENFRKMLLAMVQDIRVVIIKLADRLHNMRTITPLPPHKKRRIAHETLEIYAPIAHRLGMHDIYMELEDLGFAALYPMRHYLLKKALHTAHAYRLEVIATVEAALTHRLQAGGLTEFTISAREKHIYSIYKKMRQKHLSFNDIMDVYAFRILVPTVDDCYRTLGMVHQLYKPVPGRFKDYIAIPKTNSYQSLHTTLFGPYGKPIEVQIRTPHIHQVAESGIAAHWLYKSPEGDFTQVQARTRAWLLHLLEIQNTAGNSLEFIENVKIDLFPDEIYVFTPKGDIMELPAKSTPVDFAYAVHTAIGNRCVAARVNRRLAPLSTPLANGQTVEVLINDEASPNPAWLNFVVTGKARSNIRSFLKDQKQSDMVALGERLLYLALDNLSIDLSALPQNNIERFLIDAQLDSLRELFESIGRGTRNSLVVAQQLAMGSPGVEKTTPQHLSIKGTEGLLIKFAKCCWPIPPEAIMGVLLPDEGLMVHTEGCKKLAEIRDESKIIRMQWEEELQGEFQARLDVELENQRGILAELAASISKAGANIEHIYSDNSNMHYVCITFIVDVRDRVHLSHIIRHLRRIKAVLKITRVH